MGAARRCSPDPHFAGAHDRFLTLAHSARLCVRVSKIRRTRESALVRHRLSAPLAAASRRTKPPGRADVRPRGLSAVRHGCEEACSPRWAYAEAKAGDSVGRHRAMPPGPPKSGSVAASDGKAASSRFVEVARFADAPHLISWHLIPVRQPCTHRRQPWHRSIPLKANGHLLLLTARDANP